MSEAGIPLKQVSMMPGQSNISTSAAMYGHLESVLPDADAERLARAMEGA